MTEKAKKSFRQSMRALHRDIGFFAVDLIIIYAVSGIVLIYRDTDFLKHPVTVEKHLPPGLDAAGLGQALRMRDFSVTGTEGEIISYRQGTYNTTTGVAEYLTEDVIYPVNKFIELHKAGSKGINHYFTTALGIVLLFLALSSFWMFSSGNKYFRRGLILAVAGIVFAVVVLII